uniref:CCHC-type domain-containing protein n=1 Tax=Neobodo designis TaxID=312471 RepID=A0A7S1QX05_NEODS
MSYGAQGPPKGYSNPRGVTGTGGPRQCQKCNSKAHWSYECPGPNAAGAGSTGYVSRPSRTQLLRQGMKTAPVRAVPVAPTPREAFEAELKERAALLEAELRADAGLPPAGETHEAAPEGVDAGCKAGPWDAQAGSAIKSEPKPADDDAGDGVAPSPTAAPQAAPACEEMADGPVSERPPSAPRLKSHRAESVRSATQAESPHGGSNRKSGDGDGPLDQL